MQVIKDIPTMKRLSRNIRCEGKILGFVPTMGALHQGHLALIRKAREDCDIVVVSIFVNPTQFGPGEDFEQYPRDFAKDARVCEEEKVDFVFAPSAQDMYPEGYSTWVEVEGTLTHILEGTRRPGHFRGVTTVVAKLFNIVCSDYSYFGEKDYQQALIVKKMVKELHMDTQILLLPTVREEDGLACSSRNSYLKNEEREAARILYRTLVKAKKMIQEGEKDASYLRSVIKDSIGKEPLASIDYVAIADPETLGSVERIEKEVIVLLAVRIGRVRLIDNMRVKPGG